MITINGKSIPLIDSHAHIWDDFHGTRFGNTTLENLGYGKIRSGGKVEKLIPPAFVDNKVTAEILLGYMDDNGIDQAVILQNPCYGDQKEYVAESLRRYPDRFPAAMGKIDPREIDTVRGEIDLLVKSYGCGGVKIEVSDVPFFMDEPEYDPMWRKLVDDDLMVVIDLGWGVTPYDWNIDRLEKLLRRYPAMRLRLPHLGVARLWDPEQKYPYPELQKLLRLFSINKDNLYVDLSAMPFFIQEDEYPDARSQEILKVVYESAGSERILWGTDFPTILKLRTIRQCIEFITRQCAFLSAADRENILYRNVRRELRLA